MKRLLLPLTALLVGIAIGYYFGYVHPTMKVYRQLRAAPGYSDAYFVKMYTDMQEMGKYVEDGQAGTALASLAAILKIDSGDCQGAADKLAQNIMIYYRSYGPPTSEMSKERRYLLERIQSEATNHPVIARAIQTKPSQ